MSPVAFDLVPAQRDLDVPDGFTTSLRRDGLSKSPVTYLEFTVNGTPLLHQLRAGADVVLDYVGVIQDGWPIESVAAIERLLGLASGDLPDGRVSLYVCPECGDLGCGAITASLEFEPDLVTWRAFGIQTDNDKTAAPLGGPDDSWASTFNRNEYEQALARELDRLRRQSADFEYPHQRKRRLRRERVRGRLSRMLYRRSTHRIDRPSNGTTN